MATPLLEVLRRSTKYLGDHGSESARLDAELLMAHALGVRRLDLYLQHERPLAEPELETLRALLRRRGRGEPVAYLVGVREFFGRPFTVTPAVLVPRPETETLVARVVAWARARAGARGTGLRIADLGTGSGIIAVTLAAELEDAALVAVDVSADALAVAALNAERHGVAARIAFRSGSWTGPLVAEPPVDAVVANPPYVTRAELAAAGSALDHEPRLALDGGDDGLDPSRAILDGLAAAATRIPAAVFLEVDASRAAATAALVGAALLGHDVSVAADLAGRPRVVAAVAAAPPTADGGGGRA